MFSYIIYIQRAIFVTPLTPRQNITSHTSKFTCKQSTICLQIVYKIKKYKNTEMECVLDIYLRALAGWQIYPSFLTATLHPPHKPAVHKKEEMETKRHLKEKKTKEHAQNRHRKVSSSSSSEVNLEGWDCELWFVRNCLGRLGWANNLCCSVAQEISSQASKPC